MNEQAKLERLAEVSGLLRFHTDPETNKQRVAKFTRAAAWELRDGGWGNVRKDGGTHVQNLDIDKIMNWNTGEVVDIVIDAGIERQRVGWQVVDRLPRERWAAPHDELAPQQPAPQPGPTPEPPPGPTPEPPPTNARAVPRDLFIAVHQGVLMAAALAGETPDPMSAAQAALAYARAAADVLDAHD